MVMMMLAGIRARLPGTWRGIASVANRRTRIAARSTRRIAARDTRRIAARDTRRITARDTRRITARDARRIAALSTSISAWRLIGNLCSTHVGIITRRTGCEGTDTAGFRASSGTTIIDRTKIAVCVPGVGAIDDVLRTAQTTTRLAIT
jgi:hypothetical protein